MSVPAYHDPRWHVSSYSNSEGGDCVKAVETPETAYVRDSKEGERGGVVQYSRSAWSYFLDRVRASR